MILVLNCGSQSIKWKLFNPNLKVKKEGSVAVLETKNYEKVLLGELSKVKKHEKEIHPVKLPQKGTSLCEDLTGVTTIGHRVVHGGDKFKKPTVINNKNLRELEKLNRLAPLHNPFNVLGIKFSQSVFPKAKQIAVFDTEFFSTLPEKVYTYPLPEKIRKKYGIRKFGFHGTSHEYVARKGCEILEKSFKKVHPVKYRKAVISPKAKLFNRVKIITCHLGGGASITAINKGKAVDTSMGFTPLEGLVMMTRSGSLDPGIILYLNQKSKIKNQKLEYILNYESGIKGICGLSDMRDVLKAAKRNNKRAKLALEIFVYSIQKYIGSYFAILGGCDLLVFTGAIGAGSAKIVNMICKPLLILKSTRVLSIKTDEELAIAKKVSSI